MAATDELIESQAKLDDIQTAIVENKQAREVLREKARELRDEYIEEEKTREKLLNQVLEAQTEDEN